MIKSWFFGIFGFFFTRAAIAIASFAIVLLLILLPFFKNQLLAMVENQGQTFANTTIAATTSNLYTESYGDVIEYLLKVLKDTDNILFVVITTKANDEVVINKNTWTQSQNVYRFNQTKLNPSKSALYYVEKNPVSHVNCFMYHQEIMIGGTSWGLLTVGMSDAQYHQVKRKYSTIVGITSVGLVLVLLLLFYRNSKQFRAEMLQLTNTGLQLQRGDLAARAPEQAFGEIGTLSRAINTMAINLQEQTHRTQQLAHIVEQTNDAIILFDNAMQVVFVNDAISEVTGYSPAFFQNMSMTTFTNILQLNLDEVLREVDFNNVHLQRSRTHDFVITKKGQQITDVEVRLEFITNEQTHNQNFLVVLSNISERKRLEKELHQLAFYDKLTNLPNRRLFMDRMRQLIESSKRNKKSFALFFMDLDNFKFINDTLGHEAGDEFLVQVGKRIKGIVRSNDMVTRLGGDEFTVIVEDVKSGAHIDVGHLADKLIAGLAATPIYIQGRPLTISTSLGVAIYPENGTDSDTLVRNADIAMYSAKKSGKNRHAFFSEAMNAALRERIEIEEDLKQAIELGNQITLYYQPIVDLATEQLVGAEALVRWHHPEKGYISPVDFIPIAESSNLIVVLSEYLLNIAFKQAHAWRNLAFTPYMSVNISGRHFEKPNFIERLAYYLAVYKLDAGKIQLEFTESIMLGSTKDTIAKFQQLKQMGFKIAIDDFGTGYSSLGYIHQLPIDVIKIDRSFVIGLLENTKTSAIVTAITTLSTTLGIKTVAEGVELEVHADRLRQYHCDYGQGYLYDKALAIAAFEQKYLSSTTPHANMDSGTAKMQGA